MYNVLSVNTIVCTIDVENTASGAHLQFSTEDCGVTLFKDLGELGDATYAMLVFKSRMQVEPKKGIFVRYSDVLSAIGMETPESKERILSRLGMSSIEYSLTWDGNCPVFDTKRVFYLLKEKKS